MIELIKKEIHMNRQRGTAVSQLTLDDDFIVPDALDDAVVEVHCEGESKVVVNLYARATAVADGDGYAKVVHKNKETYDL